MTTARDDRPPAGSWADQVARELLAAVAAPRSPLGGGAVTAMTAALAAALVERCATTASGFEEERARAAALRETLVAIADDDAAVLAAMIGGSGTAAPSDPPRRLQAAATEVAELARRLERDGVPRLRGEAACAAVLADAATRAATAIVALNDQRGDPGR